MFGIRENKPVRNFQVLTNSQDSGFQFSDEEFRALGLGPASGDFDFGL